MSWNAVSHVTRAVDPEVAVQECLDVARADGREPCGYLFYFTLAHDPEELAEVLVEAVGSVPCVGGSVQGIATQSLVEEDGYLLGMMAFVGDGLTIRVTTEEDLLTDTFAVGERLGRAALAVEDASFSVLLYDPLNGVNARTMLRGFAHAAESHPLVGAATAGPNGRRVDTFQFDGTTLSTRSAVMMTVGGPLDLITAATTGTCPSGVRMTVTRSEGHHVLEFDGEPALDAWISHLEAGESESVESMSNLAMGIQRGGPGKESWAVLAPIAYDHERSGILLMSDVPEGSVVEMHRRSPEVIFERMDQMASELAGELEDRDAVAVLTFECGARTSPFLGAEASLEENLLLQRSLGSHLPWLGLMAWGEIVPVTSGSEFFNYTYPVAVLCRARGETAPA